MTFKAAMMCCIGVLALTACEGADEASESADAEAGTEVAELVNFAEADPADPLPAGTAVLSEDGCLGILLGPSSWDVSPEEIFDSSPGESYVLLPVTVANYCEDPITPWLDVLVVYLSDGRFYPGDVIPVSHPLLNVDDLAKDQVATGFVGFNIPAQGGVWGITYENSAAFVSDEW